jgi:hypothetical protein
MPKEAASSSPQGQSVTFVRTGLRRSARISNTATRSSPQGQSVTFVRRRLMRRSARIASKTSPTREASATHFFNRIGTLSMPQEAASASPRPQWYLRGRALRRSPRKTPTITFHARQTCPTNPFDPSGTDVRGNMAYCEDCYCHACSVNPACCRYWVLHCHATFEDHIWRISDARKLERVY